MIGLGAGERFVASAYRAALRAGPDADQPRNLAKSVTVE